MGDFLTAYAQVQPEKLAVVDDRPGGTVLSLSFYELEERANRLANVLASLGAAPGRKVVWCGQNSIGVVTLVNAARKVGVTAVPLNYRLAPDEAAYVTDHSDAFLVCTDAEQAPMFASIRGELPSVQHLLVYDGPAPEGMQSVEALTAGASTEPPPEVEPGRMSR